MHLSVLMLMPQAQPLTSSCRPYSQPLDLHNSQDSTPSDVIYEIVKCYIEAIEAMHVFLSFTSVGGHFNGRRSGGNIGEMLPHGMPQGISASDRDQHAAILFPSLTRVLGPP
jgi:hypothetical protein